MPDITVTGLGTGDDRAIINAALQSAKPRGRVQLPSGEFWISVAPHPAVPEWNAGLVIPREVTLAGMGPGLTVIKALPNQPATAQPARLVINETPSGGDYRICLEDFTLDGQASQQTELHEGIVMMRAAQVGMTKVYARSVRGTGNAPVNGETFAFNVTMCGDVWQRDCTADGQSTDDTASGFGVNATTNYRATGCRAVNLKHGHGVALWTCKQAELVAPVAQRMWTGNGLNFERCEDVIVHGGLVGGHAVEFDGAWPYVNGQPLGNGGVGVRLLDTKRVTFLGTVSRGNGVNFRQDGANSGLQRIATRGF